MIVKKLIQGKIVVMPTDTIYGIAGSALNKKAVERIYKLRKRNPKKPFIILISKLDDLNLFGIKLTEKQKEFLQKNWPNPLSVVLPSFGDEFKYLHRGTNSLAFRMPKDQNLLEILRKTGPLVAPSANFEGEKPAENIDQAKQYFQDGADFYVNGEVIQSAPSTLIDLTNNSIKILRQGSFRI